MRTSTQPNEIDLEISQKSGNSSIRFADIKWRQLSKAESSRLKKNQLMAASNA